jgi:Tfp pilus assembly protein PilO
MAASTASLSAPRPPAAVPRTGPWVAGGAGVLALVLVAGWFLAVSPQRSAMADTEESITQAQGSATTLSARVAQLKQQYASLPELQAELASLQVQLPGDPALPELVRALRSAAQSTGAELTGLTPGAPQALGSAPGAATPPAGDAAATPAPTSTAAADTTTVATGAAAPAGSNGLLEVPVTITATGSYAALQDFLAAVQRQQRLLLVSGTSYTPGGGVSGKDLTLIVTGDVFVLPAAGASGKAAAAATSVSTGGPAAATAAPTSTSAGLPTAAPPAVATPTATTTSAG